MSKLIFTIFVIFVSLTLPARSDEFNNILVNGNIRISDETILLFSELSDEKFLSEKSINDILKKIYQSGFFNDVAIKIENRNLIIEVIENPIIQTVFIEGIKRKKTVSDLYKILSLKNRSSFNSNQIKRDEAAILNFLKNKTHHFLENLK